MASNPCTLGTFKTVFSSAEVADHACPNPIVQVLQVKAIAAKPGTPERYRVVLSDTQNFIQSMLATQANHHVEEGQISKGSFLRLTSYQANRVKDKRILIVISVEPLPQYGTQEKIGSPVSLDIDTAPTDAVAGTSLIQPIHQANTRSFYSGSGCAHNTGSDRKVGISRRGTINLPANIYPIEAISPYQNKWTIKARVSYKSDKKEWNNGRTEGRLFTVNFLDETGEIRATAFNDECDKYFDMLQEGQVYYISKTRVNMAKKQFSNVNNDYELTLTRDSEIELCDEPDETVPQVRFNFIKISELENIEKDSTIDILGVVKDVAEPKEITSKNTQKPYTKRDITIVDNSNTMVKITIWGENAMNWDLPPENVVAFKGVKVSGFGGRSLSMLFSSTMAANPDIPEAHALKGWYEAQGSSKELSSFATHSAMFAVGAAAGRDEVYKNLSQIREENLGMSEEPDYFTCKATVVYVKHENVCYPACLNDKCNKKVVQLDEGSWRCERCDATHPKPQFRYIMTISCNDAFGQVWLNCFDDVGCLIMGISADDFEELQVQAGKKHVEGLFTAALCQTYIFRVRAKQDSFNDTPRVRYQVMSARPVDYVVEAIKLAGSIEQYNLS